MSAEDLLRFREEVERDDALAASLLGLEPANFRERVVNLARERGLTVTVDEVVEAERAGRRAWLERGLDP